MALPIRKSGLDLPSSHGGTDSGISYLNSLTKWSGKGNFSPEPIREVLKVLGSPQDKVPSIHIAGTNGKGSVSAMVASILGHEGYRVGLNTSPHLSRCNERIVIDGVSISDEKLSNYALILKEIEDKMGLRLSFHEAFTAMSFMAFHEDALDFMVIEVGLGGRLDSTNVMKAPAVTAITSIGFDHEEQLGSSLGLITREKCGIFRLGVPIVSGSLKGEAKKVLDYEARRLECRTYEFMESFSCILEDRGPLFYEDERGKVALNPALKGLYQAENIGISCKIARLLGASDRAIQEGISSVSWPARFEFIQHEGKCFILDSAHNLEGIKALAQSLKANNINKLNLCFSSLSTKNWRESLKELVSISKNVYFLKANSPSSIEFSEVENFLSCFDIKPQNFGMEYSRLISEVSSDLPLLASGSMYMVGGLRELLVKDSTPIWKRRGNSDERDV